MKKEKTTKMLVKILVSTVLVFMLTHLTKDESKREKIGKVIISLLLFFILVSLSLFMGLTGFFLGLVLIWLIWSNIEEPNDKTATH